MQKLLKDSRVNLIRPFFAAILCIFLLSQCGRAQTIKVATYNIYFLDDGISKARQHNLENVIRKLNADIIGFQEIDNPRALENILPDNYEIAMIDDPMEVQELALAVRSPLSITSYRYVYADSVYDNAFPRKRDLLEVRVAAYGREFVCLVHHAKSRRGGRTETDARREAAAVLICQYIKDKLNNHNVILMGDFNDNPDDRSLNILEYGDPNALAGIDIQEDSFLFNTSEELLKRDYCSYGYHLLDGDTTGTFSPTILGARAENEKWRGKTGYDYWTDVKIKSMLADQILVSLNLKGNVIRTGIVNDASAIAGDASEIHFVDGSLHYTKRGSLASDHVPVWIVLKLEKN